jgi:ribonucleoside-triphosphate reductase
MTISKKTSTDRNDDDERNPPTRDTIKVRRSDDTTIDFDENKIVVSLRKETTLAETLFGVPRITMTDARAIARSVKHKISTITKPDEPTTAAFVRELVGIELLGRGIVDPTFNVYKKIYTRVGMPFFDVWNNIWQYETFEHNENANLGNNNPENIHKKLADRVAKEAIPIGFPPGIEKAHYNGDMHVHQLEYIQRPFCADYDLRYVYLNGLLADGSGMYSAAAGPAMNHVVAILHAVKVLAAGQCDCQGGQGLFNFNIFVAPYLDSMPYDSNDAGEWKKGYKPTTIKQCAQMFIYEMNETYVSRGGQLVFSSIQIEPAIPKIWRNKPAVYKGKIHADEPYETFTREVQLFALALLEIYLEGDKLGKMFFFPKPEIRLRSEHFVKPDDITQQIIMKSIELSAKFGSSYFDNVIPKYRDADGQDCYQCCAYHFSEDAASLEPKLWYEDGQHFSMSGQQVVTINLPRLAYRANGDQTLLFDLLDEQMDMARRLLTWKRKNVIDFANRGHLPFISQRPMANPSHTALYDVDSASLIFGFVGMNETVQAMYGSQLHESSVAVRQGIRILAEMELIKDRFVEESGLHFAVARTPAESTAQLFATLDLLRYNGLASQYVKGNISNWKKAYDAGGRTAVPVYYTNGFMVNHAEAVPLQQKVDIEEKPFQILSGGDIVNIFLGERYPDVDALYSLVRDIATTSQIGYYTITRDLTLCNKCYSLVGGIHFKCDVCGSPNVTQFSRITGYYQAVNGWNAGKVQELNDRYKYDV